jgi:hypothetical protein
LELESSAGVLATSEWVTLTPETPRLIVLERQAVPEQDLACVAERLWIARRGTTSGSSVDPSEKQESCAKISKCFAVKCQAEVCIKLVGFIGAFDLDGTIAAPNTTVYLKGSGCGAGCFTPGTRYMPVLEEAGEASGSTPNAEGCQARCRVLTSCAFFTWTAESCDLHPADASPVQLKPAELKDGKKDSVLAGPAQCGTDQQPGVPGISVLHL